MARQNVFFGPAPKKVCPSLVYTNLEEKSEFKTSGCHTSHNHQDNTEKNYISFTHTPVCFQYC